MPQKKPHILLLIDDEHRPDVMPIEGNPHIRTPRWIDSSNRTHTFATLIPLPRFVCRRVKASSPVYIRGTWDAPISGLLCRARS